jgi:hypothetical protein
MSSVLDGMCFWVYYGVRIHLKRAAKTPSFLAVVYTFRGFLG